MNSRGENICARKRLKNVDEKNQDNKKKMLNKKKYRLQKYSNKYKINQWEKIRKKAILRGYYKELDKDQRKSLNQQSPLKNTNQDEKKEMQLKPSSAFHKAKQEFLRKKDEKRKQKEEAIRIKSEREEALKKYKERKMQTFKKLSKKTKKGQPLMKDRLEMLLEKVQQQVSN